MRIAAANLQMASTHLASQQHEIRESLRLWVGNKRPDFEGQERNRPPLSPAERVQLSDAGKSAQSSEAKAIEKNRDAVDSNPQLRLIKTLLEFLIGRKIEVFNAGELDADTPPGVVLETGRQHGQAESATQQPAGYGVEYDYHETYRETEETTFSASGMVRTADGREIGFEVSLAMQRSYAVESDVSLRLGDAARKVDPLVLNFGGTAAQLADKRFSFDLDGDGAAEQINFVGPGSGFLVFDRNRDGKPNNGAELFGPASGNGFGELAGLDADRNGWIDENDPAFENLRVWTKDSEGNDHLQSLAESRVGAMALTYVNTPFEIKDYGGETLGQTRSSGVFLQDDGKAGTIQQVDLTA